MNQTIKKEKNDEFFFPFDKEQIKDVVDIKSDFIETIDRSNYQLYSDTDSSYSMVPLSFNKFENEDRTVAYAQKMAALFNRRYQATFSKTVEKYGGVDPEFNFMDFKSEVVAYRGFFNAKKYYGLAKLWDEGTFFNPPEIKKTGGQIVKADSTEIVNDLLNEVYEVLLLDFDIKDEVELYRKIFIEIRDKYIARTIDAVSSFRIDEFAVPKKWPLREYKKTPSHIKGAALYNYLESDILRPGESFLQAQIIVNHSLLRKHLDKNPPNSEFQLHENMIDQTLNVICFPVFFIKQKESVEKIKMAFSTLNMGFDLQKIIDFNVIMKLEQFKKLFKEETIRMAS